MRASMIPSIPQPVRPVLLVAFGTFLAVESILRLGCGTIDKAANRDTADSTKSVVRADSAKLTKKCKIIAAGESFDITGIKVKLDGLVLDPPNVRAAISVSDTGDNNRQQFELDVPGFIIYKDRAGQLSRFDFKPAAAIPNQPVNAVEVIAQVGGVVAPTLSQNYPNPFNPTTTISYELSAPTEVRISVFNILGHEVAVLLSGQQPAGQHNIEFNASGLPSGIYFFRMQAGNQVDEKKSLLLK